MVHSSIESDDDNVWDELTWESLTDEEEIENV
jgi:hypothetical protein